jgi:hypothetical protein
MLEQAQQLDLPQYASGIRHMLKHIVDLLNGNLLARVVVNGAADNAVAALANDGVNAVPARRQVAIQSMIITILLHLAQLGGHHTQHPRVGEQT